ncbi:MAG: BatA domain-containing protein [Saprospiraceae bacterium]|nr:BatA domain-containing protein [Saprospiraceae bacterium]
MQFLFPNLLWALGLLAIPVIIHLFYFRRYKEVYFTNVKFLKELVEETASRNKLKNLLILLSRLLALAALIFAFAQPFLNNENQKDLGSSAVSIYVDNSWSMNAKSTEISLFQLAKKKALEIINAYTDADKFQIISNDFNSTNLRLVSKSEAKDLLEQVKVGPKIQLLSKIYAKQNQTLENYPSQNKHAFIISDFQKNSCDLSLPEDSLIQRHLIPLQYIEENNVSIDSAYFLSPIITPGQSVKVVFHIKNYGKSDIENLRVNYSYNGQDYPLSTINIKSAKEIIDTLTLNIVSKGWSELSIKINDYPIQFDDQYHLCFEVLDEIDVLLLYSKSQPEELIKYLNAVPFFKVHTQEQAKLDYGKFKENQLIILAGLSQTSSGLSSELRKAMDEGTNILVFPAADLSQNAYKELSAAISFPNINNFDRNQREASKINMDADIFDDVYSNPNANVKLPITKGMYTFTANKSIEAILTNRDQSLLLFRYSLGQAYVYVCASPFQSEFNDMSKSPEILLPFLFKASISGSKKSRFSYTIGKDMVIEWKMQMNSINGEDSRILIKGPEEFIPSIRSNQNKVIIEIFDQITKAGNYQILKNETSIGKLAFNEDRQESNLSLYSESELSEKYGSKYDIINISKNTDITNLLQSKMQKSQWWKWLLIGALLFLLFEGLLIRFLKSK